MEFRRIATLIYKKSLRWRQSMQLSVDDKLYKDAMETAAQSGERELAEELLKTFIADGNKECFAACLYTCYDLALRTKATIDKLKGVQVQAGQTSPLLQYFGTLLTKGKLNPLESLELGRLVLSQNKKQLLENWMNEDKLECDEALGDLVKATGDSDLALKIYLKAQATQKVVTAFAERGQFEELVKYSGQVGHTPD